MKLTNLRANLGAQTFSVLLQKNDKNIGEKMQQPMFYMADKIIGSSLWVTHSFVNYIFFKTVNYLISHHPANFSCAIGHCLTLCEFFQPVLKLTPQVCQIYTIGLSWNYPRKFVRYTALDNEIQQKH